MRLAAVWGLIVTDYDRRRWRPGTPRELITFLDYRAISERRRFALRNTWPRGFDAALEAAKAGVIDKDVAATLDAVPDRQVLESPRVLLEAQRAAINDTREKLEKLEHLKGMPTARIVASDLTRFTPEHVDVWKWVKENKPDNALLQKGAAAGIPNWFYVIKGAVNAFDLVLKAPTEFDRLRLLAEKGPAYGWGPEVLKDLMLVSQICEAAATTAGMWTYFHLAFTGKSAEAVAWLKAFTASVPDLKSASKVVRAKNNFLFKGQLGRLPLRTISWATSALQASYGVAVLMSDDATDSERLEAELNIGMGVFGTAGAVFTGLGYTALAGAAGWGSLTLSVGALEVWFARAQLRDSGIDYAATRVNYVFDFLEREAEKVTRGANALEETLRYGEQLNAAAGAAPAKRVVDDSKDPYRRDALMNSERREGAGRRSARQAEELRATITGLFIELDDSGAVVPKNVTRPLAEVKRKLKAATTPTQTLEAGMLFLDVVRDLFQHYDRTHARTLRESDKDYMNRKDVVDFMKLFRGLYDDKEIERMAAEYKKSPTFTSREKPFASGPLAPSSAGSAAAPGSPAKDKGHHAGGRRGS